MERTQEGLSLLISRISEENYDQTFACYRLWFEITQTYCEKYPDQIFDSLFHNRGAQGIQHGSGNLIHSAAHLIVRFARDAESDNALAPYTAGLQHRLCAAILQEFFKGCMGNIGVRELRSRSYNPNQFLVDANFVAHWVNLGYVGESSIRNHILQSLISHPRLYEHQADALIVLFKLAGATFEKYADPSVVDRCFELLKGRYSGSSVKGPLVQVRVVSCNGWLEPG